MQRHGAQVCLPLLLPLHEGFLPPHLSLNLSSTLQLTHAQYFSYWLPSSVARICLAGLHPVSLAILLFHPQLLQVTRCLNFILLFFVEPLTCAVALPSGSNYRGHGQFASRLHLLPRRPVVHRHVLRVREQRGREHNWLHRHEPEYGGAPQQGVGSHCAASHRQGSIA